MADEIDLETDLTEAILDAAATPESASADGVNVQARPIPDLIAADKHMMDREDREAARTAARSASRGLRITRLLPPGTGA